MNTQNTRNILEELRSLYQKINETEEGRSIWQQENAKRGQLMQGVQRGLRELKISVALVQLDLVAPPEITDKVSLLALEGNTGDLRHLILGLVSNLEQYIIIEDEKRLDMVLIKRSIKTLAILIELLDSLESSV